MSTRLTVALSALLCAGTACAADITIGRSSWHRALGQMLTRGGLNDGDRLDAWIAHYFGTMPADRMTARYLSLSAWMNLPKASAD